MEERTLEKYLDELGYGIYTSDTKRKIGEVVNAATGIDGIRSLGQPFVVVREATLAEYQEFDRGLRKYLGKSGVGDHFRYFYEVRTD